MRMQLHPAAQITSLALLTILLARLHGPGLILAVGPLTWLIFRNRQHAKPIFRMMGRLRWFFLTILILYTWFTPSAELFNSSAAFSFLPAGLSLGLERIAALLIVVGYSSLLLRINTREDIIAGIYMIVLPLQRLGVNADGLAVRLGLVLDYVPRFEEIRHELGDTSRESKHGNTWMGTAAALFECVPASPAGQRQGERIELAKLPSPGLLDLVVPAGLAMLIVSRMF